MLSASLWLRSKIIFFKNAVDMPGNKCFLKFRIVELDIVVITNHVHIYPIACILKLAGPDAPHDCGKGSSCPDGKFPSGFSLNGP